MKPIIECIALSKYYSNAWWSRRKIRALTNVYWTVHSGERWLVTGPNRAGKSTLLRLLVSLLQPSTGQIYRWGLPASRSQTLREVGYVCENASLPGHWRTEPLLYWLALLRGLSPALARPRVSQILDRFQVKDYANWRICHLSRGLRQRVALACAWVHVPQLLILDDPTNALDSAGLDQFFDCLRNTDHNQTVILATTNSRAFIDWASHVLELNAGQVAYCGPAAAYFAHKSSEPMLCEDAYHAVTH